MWPGTHFLLHLMDGFSILPTWKNEYRSRCNRGIVSIGTLLRWLFHLSFLHNPPQTAKPMTTLRSNLFAVVTTLIASASAKCDPILRKELDDQIKRDVPMLFGLMNQLVDFQLENFRNLLRYYEESLSNIVNYGDEEKAEYFLSLTDNLVRDVRGYILEYEHFLKKQRECALEVRTKVAESATFLIYTPTILRYNHGRN